MVHERLLVVTSGAETIGTIIHEDGDKPFLIEGEMVFPRDFEFHHESITDVCEDGALLYTLTECSGEEPLTAEAPPRRH
jgi:hypothetical protein